MILPICSNRALVRAPSCSGVEGRMSTACAISFSFTSGATSALAVGATTRSPLLPEVPTVAESGLPGYEFVTWLGVYAPLHTPAPIIARMNAEIGKALAAPDLKEKLIAQAVDVRPSTPEQLGALTKARFEQMGKIIKEAGITAE